MTRCLLLLLCISVCRLHADVRSDVEYARVEGVPLTLDASIPDGPGPFPAVIVVHGGGFTKGDKQTYVQPLFPVLTQANFAWFSINYRLAPKFRFPAAVEDVEKSIQYVKSHAKQYRIDPKRIALVGESAGGYLASYVGAIDHPAARVAAVVSFYGPHDPAGRARKLGDPTGSVRDFWAVTELNEVGYKRLEEASPVFYVHHSMPPFLLIHGTKDYQVPYDQSVDMCDRMKQVGASCELYTVEGAPHGMMGWEKNPEWQGYKQKMVDWLRDKLAEQPAKKQ